MLLGTAGGLGLCYATKGIQRSAEKYSVLFRKPWMKLPWNLAIFTLGYSVVYQLPARLFNQRQVTFERYTGEIDYVSRFRYFE
jgi:hypothetical protein